MIDFSVDIFYHLQSTVKNKSVIVFHFVSQYRLLLILRLADYYAIYSFDLEMIVLIAPTKQRSGYFTPKRAAEEITYRIPMEIQQLRYYTYNHTSYAVCPRCRISLDREYIRFCDVCGQRLSWKNYGNVIVITLPTHKPESEVF